MKIRIASYHGSSGKLDEIKEFYPDCTVEEPNELRYAERIHIEIDESEFFEFCCRYGPMQVYQPGQRYATDDEWFIWVTDVGHFKSI